VYRALLRDLRFRRALSLAIHRYEINQVVYFRLVEESNNTVLREGPLYRPEYQNDWIEFDLETANRLLDELGLEQRDDRGVRLMSDGRPLEIMIQTAGESTEQTDVLELIHDSWLRAGIKLYSVPSTREVFRNRIFSGEALMSIWSGLANAIPTAESSPKDLAPTSKYQYQWPRWGSYYESNGKSGEAPDLPAARRLVELNDKWARAPGHEERVDIWHEMLEINREQMFTIGIVNHVPHPVAGYLLVRRGQALMLHYILRRILTMIPTLLIISMLVFVIIQLPPGDYLESHIAELQSQGESVDEQKIQFLREQYGLDKPMVQQYWYWLTGMLQADFGYSFEYDLPVTEVVGDRLFLTVLISIATILFTWAVAFPIGIYSATHQYSWGDYGLSTLGFLGLATPNFLLALVMLYLANVYFGTSIGGLMEPEYIDAPWSLDKVLSILEHLWIPVVVIGTSGTAGMIRRLRANLLDELQKQYVTTGRAKGLPPGKLLRKYPLRIALNFFVADIGNLLPTVISGAEIVAVVMSLPTTGPILLSALQSQDMYLAGSFLMFLALLTVFGVLVSDILLALLDPRIRLGGSASK
jgi:peptide/nickel transport system permease protein